MFGYIVPEKPEMKIKEYELFRAYYCGVCRSIGKRHGQFKRLTLSYDSAFLAVLLTAIADERVNIEKKRCMAHPLAKRHMAAGSGVVDYASDINILLAYYNLKDKRRDGGKIIPAAAMAALHRVFLKLRKRYDRKCGIMENRLNELISLEKEKCASMDKAAEPFARLMEEVTAYEPLCSDEKNEQKLRWIGYNLGKWIYLIDAFDDIEEDITEGNYNPLIYQYGYESGSVAEFKRQIQKNVEFNLTYSLNEIAKAYELFNIKINSGILENIIYMGMLRKTENILGIRSCNKIGKSV